MAIVRDEEVAASHREVTTVLTTTMTTVELPRHLSPHDNRTHIVPDRTIGLYLRIRRLGVRIPSGARHEKMASDHQCSGVRAYFVSAAVPAGVTALVTTAPNVTDAALAPTGHSL
jgi:hypothetical protein